LLAQSLSGGWTRASGIHTHSDPGRSKTGRSLLSEPFRGPKWPINGSQPFTDPFADPSDIPMTTRLIETWLPTAALGLEGLRVRTLTTPLPAPNRLHVWWPRRPLVTLGNRQDQCHPHS
jgi:hypothetical protein